MAVLVGAFTIFNSLSITVAQRTKEFGLLRMVGATRRQVRGGVLLEALVIGLLASAAGHRRRLRPRRRPERALRRASGMDLPAEGLELATRTIVVSLLVGTLATVLAAAIPARRATQIAPVAALRDSARRRPAGPLRPRRARRWRASSAALAALGGAAGPLARRNAMRNPGRTAVTASALMIGVMLVTAVTVVAQGLKDESTRRARARACRPRASSPPPTAGRRSTPRSSRPRSRRPHTSIRQDGALVFGHQEGVNGVDPAKIGALLPLRPYDRGHAHRPTARWSTRASPPSTACASAARSRSPSMSGKTLDLTVRGIEKSPVLDVLGLGPITIPQAAFDRTFEQRPQPAHVRRPRRQRRRSPAFPNAKVAGQGRRSSTARPPGSG